MNISVRRFVRLSVSQSVLVLIHPTDCSSVHLSVSTAKLVWDVALHIYAEVVEVQVHETPTDNQSDTDDNGHMTIVLENVIKDEHKIIIHVTNKNDTLV